MAQAKNRLYVLQCCLFSLHIQLLYKSLYFSFSVTYIFSFFLRFSRFLYFPTLLFYYFSLSFSLSFFPIIFLYYYFSLILFSYILLSFLFTHSFHLILNKALGLASLSTYKLNKSFVCVKMGQMALSITRGNSAEYLCELVPLRVIQLSFPLVSICYLNVFCNNSLISPQYSSLYSLFSFCLLKCVQTEMRNYIIYI